MTLGELLDAAMALLRRRALPKQRPPAPRGRPASLPPPYYGPAEEHVTAWWTVVSIGLGLELLIVTLLGAPAGAAAGPALLGRAVPHRQLWRRTRPVATVAAAVTLGAIGAVGAFLGFVPWIIAFGLFGMT